MVRKQMNIKNRTYYFYNDLINIKDFHARLLKLDKKTSMSLGIYYIGYVTKKPEYEVDSVNPLYLVINRIDGFFEEKECEKVPRSSEWNKNCVIKINCSELGEYDKHFMKIQFNSGDVIPLNKQLYFPTITVTIRRFLRKMVNIILRFFR